MALKRFRPTQPVLWIPFHKDRSFCHQEGIRSDAYQRTQNFSLCICEMAVGWAKFDVTKPIEVVISKK